MRIISERILREYWEAHADTRGPLEAWLEFVRRAKWEKPADAQKAYGDDVVISSRRLVFNIKGNNYRLVADVHYNSGILFIRFIGTHAEYNKIDAKTV